MPLLDVQDLRTHFHTRNGVVRAVEGVSFALEKGDTLGIVGESGSGKSVTCYSLLRLLPMPPAKIESGRALLGGLDLLSCPEADLRRVRGKRVGMIFQDPMTSLNPFLRVGDQLTEPLELHERTPKKQAWKRALEALEEVGIKDAERRAKMYPHEFSGGMRQRVMIAMAMITKPDLLIADEPTTALDVTVQAQILELIRQRQKDLGTAVILITHDLGVVAGFCRRVNVMYGGRILESGPVDAIFAGRAHPYTRALQRSIPALQEKGRELFTIPGAPPSTAREIVGCPFAPRCGYSAPVCAEPLALAERAPGHQTACVRVQRENLEPA